MAEDKLTQLNEYSLKILDDLVAITSNKLRNISDWHVGVFEGMQFSEETVKNCSVFLMYKFDNPNDCVLIHKIISEKIQLLPSLNKSEFEHIRPHYLIFWHSLGADAEK